MDRREFLLGLASGGVAATAGGLTTVGLLGGFGGNRFNYDQKYLIDFGPTIRLEPVAEGFRMPVDFAAQPGHDRRYIVDRYGTIGVHEADGLRPEPLVDLSQAIVTSGEQGLLGLALHPDFGSNRKLYIRYSAARRSGTPEDFSHTFVLSEFTVTEDYRSIVPDSERTLLEIPQPHRQHNAGDLAFGPDGHLYVTVGDGGFTYDYGPRGKADDWYWWNKGGNGQDVTQNLLGSILRLDVDRSGEKPYGIPSDNPLVGREGLDEHYAWGLRNPWKLSFHDDDLFVSDVGQGDFEEVNLVERGGNYGWNVKEGTMCLNMRSKHILTNFPLPWCPGRDASGTPLSDPIIQYPHRVRKPSGDVYVGSAVVGGYVYQNDSLPPLAGNYVFGDLLSATYGSGRLFVATEPDTDGKRWPVQELAVEGRPGNRLGGLLLGFGTDQAGDLYVLNVTDSGRVDKVVAAD